ncbi:MAG: DNA repair protein RecN [Bacteroidales bacterium]|nr:DNA repair protein RecN [Bacteroidales bacterium]
MIKSLTVNNYALIEELSVDFDKGLTIITGETGAGKSILLGALALIRGQRVDTSVLLNRDANCIVEADFDIKNYNLQSFFNQNDIDYSDITTIRRQINPNGKSRAFVNDVPVNLPILKDLSNKLIDIHSQHNNLLLNNSSFQTNIVDTSANCFSELVNYQKKYKEYTTLSKEIERLVETSKKEKEDLDYYQFQLDQLVELNADIEEYFNLESEINELENADLIKGILDRNSYILSEQENNITSQIKAITNDLEKISQFNPSFSELHNRLKSSYIEIADIASDLGNLSSSFEANPERTNWVTERLSNYNSLLKKHNLSEVEQLIALQHDFNDKVGRINNFDDKIEELNKELSAITTDLTNLANILSNKREKAFTKIEKHILDKLANLGMKNSKFCIANNKEKGFNTLGIDNIEFLFNANKQGELQEIGKVASGGETSRLMLSLKSLLATNKTIPTLLFDEIDTGVSGDIADKMGNIIKEMSATMQIINITHLPQVAGKGDIHLKVYKEDTQTATKTKIKLLSNDERILELAKMLSGEQLSDAAVSNARELLMVN